MTSPLEPIPEAYAGTNNPYRGIEQHGVETNNQYQPVPGYGDTVQVEYQHPEPMQEPVPVIIVNESSREERDWGVHTFTAVDRLVQLIGRDPTRTSLNLVNSGPNTVYLAPDPRSNTTEMYPVPINGTFSLDAETEIWCLCATGESANLRVMREFRRSLPER